MSSCPTDHPDFDDFVAGAASLLGLPPAEVRVLPLPLLIQYCNAYTEFVALHARLGGVVLMRRAVRTAWPPGTFIDNARDFLINNPN